MAISCIGPHDQTCSELTTAHTHLAPLSVVVYPSPTTTSTGTPSLTHQSYAFNHVVENLNRWDPPNVHYILHNNTSPSLRYVSTRIPPPISRSDEMSDKESERVSEGVRRDAVCVTQTFRNDQSGPMLYMFVRHYHSLGWTVLVYDVSADTVLQYVAVCDVQ
jgi:hypothetical protein